VRCTFSSAADSASDWGGAADEAGEAAAWNDPRWGAANVNQFGAAEDEAGTAAVGRNCGDGAEADTSTASFDVKEEESSALK
jgi:hypothetical protein